MDKEQLNGFAEFFKSKLKNVTYYSDNDEMMNDIESAIENMEYDMRENLLSLYTAFQNACRDLYVDPDGIESFIFM